MPDPRLGSRPLPVACFAPPLTDESLARYRVLADSCPDAEVRDALRTLLACVGAWWELPASSLPPRRWRIRHRGEDVEFSETPLERPHAEALWDVTPWMREVDTLSTPAGDGPFDALPPGELRDCAFHLLWFAKELTLDREPLTLDALGD